MAIIPNILPDPYTIFLNNVASEFNTQVRSNRYGRYIHHERANCIKVMCYFSGLDVTEIGRLFMIDRASLYHNIREAHKHPATYNRILQIFIDTLNRYRIVYRGKYEIRN